MNKLNPDFRNDDHENDESVNEFTADVSNYLPAPAGNHLARCVGLIALGTHRGEYKGKIGEPRKKIMMTWELPEALHVFNEDEGEQPFLVSRIYSLVISDKATYTQHMQGWTGGRINRDFNPLQMVGKPCQLSIIHKQSADNPERVRSRVSTIMGLTKNQPCPERINPISVLTFGKWDESLFNEQSDWIKKTIEASPEYKAMKGDKVTGDKQGEFQKKENPVDPYTKIPPTKSPEVSSENGLPF